MRDKAAGSILNHRNCLFGRCKEELRKSSLKLSIAQSWLLLHDSWMYKHFTHQSLRIRRISSALISFMKQSSCIGKGRSLNIIYIIKFKNELLWSIILSALHSAPASTKASSQIKANSVHFADELKAMDCKMQKPLTSPVPHSLPVPDFPFFF